MPFYAENSRSGLLTNRPPGSERSPSVFSPNDQQVDGRAFGDHHPQTHANVQSDQMEVHILVEDSPDRYELAPDSDVIPGRWVLRFGPGPALPTPPVPLAAPDMNPQRLAGRILNSDNINIGKSHQQFTRPRGVDLHRGAFGNQVSS